LDCENEEEEGEKAEDKYCENEGELWKRDKYVLTTVAWRC
jgi:hypothetical protein